MNARETEGALCELVAGNGMTLFGATIIKNFRTIGRAYARLKRRNCRKVRSLPSSIPNETLLRN